MNEYSFIIDELIKVEGGYSDNPNDPGGPTNYGITIRVARRHGYPGHMRDLPLELAREIYYKEYIVAPKYDRLRDITSLEFAHAVIDAGVNTGTGRATRWLQTSLNALNNNQRLYKDISVDGSIGPMTLDAVGAYMAHRKQEGLEVLTKAFKCLQGAHYINISQSNKNLEAFVYGWLKNRI